MLSAQVPHRAMNRVKPNRSLPGMRWFSTVIFAWIAWTAGVSDTFGKEAARPRVAIESPRPNARYASSSEVHIVASVTDRDSATATVEFVIDGDTRETVRGNLIGRGPANPFQIVVSNLG